VETTGKRSAAAVATDAPVPVSADEAQALLEDTRERLREEVAIADRNAERVHDLRPGDLMDILA